MGLRKFLKRKAEQMSDVEKEHEYVTHRQFNDHVEEEAKLRRSIVSRISAIEIEYGLDVEEAGKRLNDDISSS